MTPDLTSGPGAAPVRPDEIVSIVESHGGERSSLMSVLGDIQSRYRHLPEDALRIVSESTGVPLIDVYAAATFYHSFSLKPKGRHIVQCCLGTACHVRGGARVAEELQRRLGVMGGETTPDGEFSLETVNCLGACAMGPVVVVDGRIFSKVNPSKVGRILADATAPPGEVDVDNDRRIFALSAHCPNCGSDLMDQANVIYGKPSIGLVASYDSTRGWARICGLYGVRASEMEHAVPEGSSVDFSCPHCQGSLANGALCAECGSPMAGLGVTGGVFSICSRLGCDGRLLDFGRADAPAGTVSTKGVDSRCG